MPKTPEHIEKLRDHFDTSDRTDLDDIHAKEREKEFAERFDVSLAPDEYDRGVAATSAHIRSKSGGLGKEIDRDFPVTKSRLAARPISGQYDSPEEAEAAFEQESFVQQQPTERVPTTHQDYRQARNRHEQRSETAQRVDQARDAPLTGDYDEWASAPDEYDFPGVDSVVDVEPRFK